MGLYMHPQLSSIPPASLGTRTAHCSSGSSTFAQSSSPRWIGAAPHEPPAPQSASRVQVSGAHVPAAQIPTAPGVVQIAPALPDPFEQCPDACPAVQTLPPKGPNEQRPVSVIPRSPEPNVPPQQPAPSAPQVTPPVETPPREAVVAAEKPAEGVSDSTVHEQTEKIETQRFYIVRRGDTLSKISAKYYGSAGQWRKILEANKQTLTNPDKLTPGQKLIIP